MRIVNGNLFRMNEHLVNFLFFYQDQISTSKPTWVNLEYEDIVSFTYWNDNTELQPENVNGTSYSRSTSYPGSLPTPGAAGKTLVAAGHVTL